MENHARATVPAHYDAEFLAGDFAVRGWLEPSQRTGETYEIITDAASLPRLIDRIADYPTAYLAVVQPKLLTEASKARDARINGFTFNGMTIPLDDKTQSNIQGAALGLTRNEDEESIPWSMGGGVFVDIPRAAMLALADAAFLHVQRCFKAHKAIAQTIMAAETIDDLADLDMQALYDEQLA